MENNTETAFWGLGFRLGLEGGSMLVGWGLRTNTRKQAENERARSESVQGPTQGLGFRGLRFRFRV